MNIIEKNHIPEEIVNDDSRFLETTYFLFRDLQLSIQELNQYFQEYHKEMDSSYFMEKILESYTSYFHDYAERALKAFNSTYLRYFMKDLKRQVSFQYVSQSYTKRMIGLFISEIILKVCVICHRNVFREKYMDIFEESVDENHLKKEFQRMIMILFQPLFDGKMDEISERDYHRFHLYQQMHARYIVEMDDEEKCLDIQKHIQELLLLSNDEIDHLYDQQKKDLDEKIQLIYGEIDTLEDEESSLNEDEQTDNQFYQTVSEQLKQVDEEELEELISSNNTEDEMSQKDEKTIQQLKPIYQKYFMYDQDQFSDYFKKMKVTYHLINGMKKVKKLDILGYLTLCLFDYDGVSIDESVLSGIEVEDEYYFAFEKAIECLNLLAFYLWHRRSKEEQYQKIQAFQAIMKEIPECYQQFLELREEPTNEEYIDMCSEIFQFSPMDKYHNDIVLAVLLKIDNPAISRRVKKLILTDYDHFDLIQMSLQMTEFYETKGITVFNMYNICELADLFVMSYIKDAKSIAGYSPFMRSFDDIYKMYSILFSGLESDVICCLNHYGVEDIDLKFRKNIFSIEEKFTKLVEYYCENKDDLFLKRFQQLEALFILTGKSLHFFMSPSDFDVLLKEHKYKLIAYMHMKSKEEFFKQSLVEQLDELIYVACIFYIIQDIGDHEEYMPMRQQIQHDTYIESLNQIIADKDEIILIKDQQIENISSKQIKKKENKNKDMKLLEQELKYYKQEISSLNKQLTQKNQEIEEFKGNQDELFKLRNLIFTLQQDEEIQTDESVDISSLIEGKTIVIIGGHIHTREKLKQKYPSLKILAQSSHIHNAVLVNADHVFLYYKFMTHDMYNKAISVLSKNEIPWDYISYTNLEKSEQVIAQILTQKYQSER